MEGSGGGDEAVDGGGGAVITGLSRLPLFIITQAGLKLEMVTFLSGSDLDPAWIEEQTRTFVPYLLNDKPLLNP